MSELPLQAPNIVSLGTRSCFAGHIGYSLTTLIAQGLMFGSTPVYLRLLDVKQALVPLEGLRLELLDLASPLLRGEA